MVQLTALWLPILLAAVFVFIASSVIHMVLGYHKSDYGKVESEDGVMDALRKFDIPPGDYMVPSS
jgi:multisubunit Na+/H+ antiporter MnhG subunit